jgi:hypothetical protein
MEHEKKQECEPNVRIIALYCHQQKLIATCWNNNKYLCKYFILKGHTMMKMMKKMLSAVLVMLALTHSANAFNFPFSNGAGASSATQTIAMLESTLQQSQAILSMSEQLKTNSASLNGNEANTEYIAAMLNLSSDIGEMANRIGEMANRIVVTEGLIGQMADRIVVVAGEIIATNGTTQSNLLVAQTNFSTALAQNR